MACLSGAAPTNPISWQQLGRNSPRVGANFGANLRVCVGGGGYGWN